MSKEKKSHFVGSLSLPGNHCLIFVVTGHTKSPEVYRSG